MIPEPAEDRRHPDSPLLVLVAIVGVAFLVLVGAVVALAVDRFASSAEDRRQTEVIGDLVDILKGRTAAFVYLEQQGAQEACVDRVEAEYERAIAQVVLAALAPDPVPGEMPPARPEEFAGDLNNALIKLQHLSALCPQPPLPAILGGADGSS